MPPEPSSSVSSSSRATTRADRPDAEFHYFPRLPVELQLMIWGFYRGSKAIRHSFSIKNGQRVYAAFDEEKGKIVSIRAKRGDSSIVPGVQNIRLTGKVCFETRDWAIKTLWKPASWVEHERRDTSAAGVLADFEHDVFYSDLISFIRRSRNPPGWFRFVRNPISQSNLTKLKGDRWVLKVEKLALPLWCHGPSPDQADEFDMKVLTRMTSLKTVMFVFGGCELTTIGGGHGFELFRAARSGCSPLNNKVYNAVIEALGARAKDIDLQYVVDRADPPGQIQQPRAWR
ncbi:Uu.00g143390.m01.CDS01 [Anthostomella pinea]|uniref:Uu.00g143390.m01.CDS01 n=1 Tax=Anthostomella pinea TaxID=933095 RepID=A0AAI8VRJ8_9PEZI|nr:Uu.00g143390.m01.CDS01 [Anthostomella pinea]